jgi:hypothetical protein
VGEALSLGCWDLVSRATWAQRLAMLLQERLMTYDIGIGKWSLVIRDGDLSVGMERSLA